VWVLPKTQERPTQSILKYTTELQKSKETKICNNTGKCINCWVLQKFRLGEEQNTRVCKEDEERDWIC
jgi:hypothetical protein